MTVRQAEGNATGQLALTTCKVPSVEGGTVTDFHCKIILRTTLPIITGMDNQPEPLVIAEAAGIFAASPKPRFTRKKTLALKSTQLAHSAPFNGV